jgi:hypothetical protein
MKKEKTTSKSGINKQDRGLAGNGDIKNEIGIAPDKKLK